MSRERNQTVYGARDDAHGPTAREADILARHERGDRPFEIAHDLGLKAASVRVVISRYALNQRDDNWQGSAASGSKALLAAIRRHHPERCSPPSARAIPAPTRAAGASAPPAAHPVQGAAQ
jgi:hypothetical protein